MPSLSNTHLITLNLSLKGGAAYHFATEFLDMNRPTADFEVHTYEVLAYDDIVSLFQKAVDVEDGDGMTIEISKTSILEHQHGEHHGIRIHIVALLGKTRIPTYADVGIGGEPPVGMRDIRVQPMVEGQSAQTIRVAFFAYCAAEKLHSVVTRGMTNSRMKDYRDLLVLARGVLTKPSSGRPWSILSVSAAPNCRKALR